MWLRRPKESSWIDFAFCAVFIVLGGATLWDARHWAATVYVGGDQFGDAQFWWDGALHFSQGIVAGNPNLLYRMGYAAFAGSAAAVLGSDFLVFHKLLLGLFLFVAAGLYCQLRTGIGRIAAAAVAALLVFNPYTAEWLAVSSSDSLGMIFNLGAILALNAGLREDDSRRRLRRLALAGALLAAASLTRPLMTLMAAPAALAVWAAAGWRVRTALPGWAALAAPFLALTLSWMGLMAALSGNFAISGASQDASIFYAASDPHIQVWNPSMYPAVEDAARARDRGHSLTASRVNHEFWTLTARNYRRHWRYQLGRLGPHLAAMAALTPARATAATPATDRLRLGLKLGFTLLLAAAAAARRRWSETAAAVILGAAWAWWPPFQLWALLAFATAGLAALFFRRLTAFVWSAYWWAGVAALYFTGGTFGPPLGAAMDVNALGYRLGFQFFFVSDLLIAGGIAFAAGARPMSPVEEPASVSRTPLGTSRNAGAFLHGTDPRPPADRALIFVTRVALAILTLILALGAGKVAWRMVARSHMRAVPFPDLAVLAGEWSASAKASADGRAPRPSLARNPGEFYADIAAGGGGRFLTTAMSSGFVWNLPGQDRCLLLLYQQQEVRPVRMAPYSHLVEIPAHVPADPWRLRQGAWLLRSFTDAPDRSNQAYYVQVAAVQAFIPLAADGHSFELARATVFPLCKYASQLDADRELAIDGAEVRWAVDSGGEKFPRRLGLRPRSAAAPLALRLDLAKARGRKVLHFGWRMESGVPRAAAPPLLEVTADSRTPALWTSHEPTPGGPIHWVSLPLPDAHALRLTAGGLLPSDTLWLYELTLTADDYLP